MRNGHGRSTGLVLTRGRVRLTLSAEDRVLLATARQELEPGHRDELVSALGEIGDWDSLLFNAGWHKLDGLLYTHLRSVPTGIVPPEVVSALRDRHRGIVVRRMYFRQELAKILEALRGAGIEAIVLKGAALAETVYRDPGVRPMADLDLLVRDAGATAAQAIVQDMGYREHGTPEDREETAEWHRHLPVLLGVGKPTVVEVHRHVVRLDSPLHFDISGFWKRARACVIAGAASRVLSPEDQLIHLCLNFFMDRRFRSGNALNQLTDISEVSKGRAGSVDWDLLASLATEYRVAGPLGCALVLAADMVEAPLPSDTLNRLWGPERIDADLSRFAARRVLSSEEFIARELIEPGRDYSTLAVARSMFRRLFPAREYMVSRYGDSARGLAGLRMYGLRLGEGAAMFVRGGARPGALREDLAVDRWLHSLYGR
ncbi:MAG: nucleotidyltransferase family protein [Chloroflexi bacterium]|nr:nucleotidyltransferase family protein [Chloroflexota bacterium]